MKLLMTFIFSLQNLIAFSQQESKEIQVEYQLFCDTNQATKLFTTLYANSNTAVYQEKYSTAEDWQEHAKKLPEGVKRFGATDPDDSYFKIDSNSKKIFFFDIIASNNFLVEDNYPDFNWNITSETKNIAGYPCIKATTSYRGRTWVAWFTPQIPISFGPWKLFGLPGLIVEAYDTDNKYTFKPIKIEFKKNDILKKDFATLMETKNTKPITYQQFLKDTEEFNDNLINDVRDSNVTITRIPFPREGEELKFEWEE